MNVTVKCCNDLLNADSGDGGLSDPYVKLQLGEYGTVAKTKRINNNLNPVFNELHKMAWNGEDPGRPQLSGRARSPRECDTSHLRRQGVL